MPNILIVEDDLLLAQTLEDILESENYSCKIAHSFEEALDVDFSENFDLYLLDINLPTQSGIELLKEFRANQIKIPAIFLTSHKEKQMLNNAFMSGCDDYIKKPFDNEELLLRIEAVLRRYNKSQETIQLGENLIYDPKTLTISSQNGNEKLTQKLAILLDLLLANKNNIVSKDEIIQNLWSEDESYSDGALRVYITKLKNLLGKDSIENTKGVGYKLKL